MMREEEHGREEVVFPFSRLFVPSLKENPTES
jgi:hypothetical protein